MTLLADVEATIYMARLIRDRALAVWNYLMPLVDKGAVTAALTSAEPKGLVEYHMGFPSLRAVVGCGHHPKNPTMQAVFDLRRDPAEVLNLSEEDLLEVAMGPNRALRTVYANKVLALVDQGLVGDLQCAIGLPTAEIVRRAAVMAADGQFAARVGVAMEQRYPPFEPAQVVEGRMYEGFPSRADEARMQAFHAAAWGERAEIAETLEDERYLELARRIVFHEQPDALQPERRQMLEVWLQNHLQGREGVEAGRSIGEAFKELEDTLLSDPSAQVAVSAIRAWLETYPA